MKYKQKLIILLTTIGVLALAYIFSFIFAPERMRARTASFSWLDPKLAASAEKISLRTTGSSIELLKRNGLWVVAQDEQEYPAKQLRADDLIAALTRHASYPVRTSNASAHERLGLDEGAASRITVLGANGTALLDLLLGHGDAAGQDIYMRKFGSNEVRSGEDKFSAYLFSAVSSWYNLRLVPETEDNRLDIDKVQRLTVYPGDGAGGSGEQQIFSRRARQWAFNLIDDADLDMEKVEAYIRAVLYAEGDDFSSEIAVNDPMLNNSRIIIELGTGDVKTIYLSAALEPENRRYATVSGTKFVYSIADWMAGRLFNTADHFKKEE